jgi:serine/threonine-protein kinase
MPALSPEEWHRVSPYLDDALEMAPEDRGEWLSSIRRNDPELASILQQLLDEEQYLEQEGFLESSLLPSIPGLAGQSVGAYTLVSPIGQGGMGSVWMARRSDGRFERMAAVKFVNLALAGHAAEERFKREGSILGRLTHPHIAELLDAGVSQMGQPYLVLEYVDGTAIDQYCDEHKLEVESRIRLFLDVLAALTHAHSNLIVHRDIKPSNVLVTSKGKVKLLDFGIAKLLEAESQAGTATLLTHESGSALTPLYAAPEQLLNEPVTTATDIYALGVLLHVLLTGQHPAGSSVHSSAELIRHVLDVDSPKPSDAITGDNANVAATKRNTTPEKLRRELRGDLDTIVRKALKKKPSERYRSTTALADDLSRYLSHEPISARPDSFGYRARKFMVRNRALVGLSTAAIALVIASLSTGLYVANRQRKIAERRFAQVRQLANKFIDLDNKIRGIPGATSVRMEMVSDSLEYLTSLSSESHIDKELALEIALAYVRVAHAQGDPTSPNLGQFAEARISLDKAAHFVEMVLQQDPGNANALFTAATIAHDQMVLSWEEGRTEEEVAEATRTASLLERVVSAGTSDPKRVYSIVYFYTNVAGALDDARRFDDAIRYSQRAFQISHPVASARRMEGNLYVDMATALWQSGDLDGALKTEQHAVELLRKEAEGGHASLRSNLSYALNVEGMILGRRDAEPSLGRTREAVAAIQEASEIVEDLARKDPNDYLGRHRVALYELELANILRHSDPHKAIQVYEHALTRIREAKTNASTQRDEAELLIGSSYAFRWIGKSQEARQRIDRALALLQDARRYPADKVEPMSDVYDAFRARADDYSEMGETDKAIEAYQQLLDKLTAWNLRAQDDLRDATCISRTWSALAGLLRKVGKTGEADALDAKRTELWNGWSGKRGNAQFLLRQSLVQITSNSIVLAAKR